MRKFWISTVLILTLTFITLAQNSEPKTVTDFYYLLPEEHFAPPELENRKTPSLKAYRKSIIKIEDIKNGYLKVQGIGWEGWAEVAIFKKTNGKYIVGIIGVGCGPICESSQHFLSYENGNWSEITSQVLPKISEAQIKAAYQRHNVAEDEDPGIVYALPRVGRTIKVTTDGDKNLVFFELTWNGEKFVLTNK